MTRRDRTPEPTQAPPTRAFVVHVETKAAGDARSPEARLAEAQGLALAIDLDVVGSAIVRLAAMRPSTLIGAGKVEELASRVSELEAGLVIFNAQLTPGQQRNLEKALKAKVLDRTGLILEIFGRRARTREGALQVELAHLTYQKSRLVRSWTHLERQRGGFGFLGGPGETQIEADRRMIEERVAKLERDLEGVRKTRALHRKGRARVPYPIVALVGYTNAGKSTLFNTLTRAGVDARDLLFATLDPTMRQVRLPHGRKIVLSDTVGFISNLPTMLIAAFRATLEEVLEADVILHVRDMASPEAASEADDVAEVLEELGIDERRRAASVLEVWNKADLLPEDRRQALGHAAERREDAVLVSALTGEGLDDLLATIEQRLARKGEMFSIALEAEEGAELAWIYGHAEVLERTDDRKHGRVRLMARFEPSRLALARRRFGARLEAPEAFAFAAE
ncbi:MAG: GTPase HflX [Parvibaculaceae bacterium]